MRRIFLLALSVLSFMSWIGSANGKEPKPVLRDDCHLSFLAPVDLEYIEVDGALTTGKDECYIAFKYAGDMRVKPSGRTPVMPEDWRAMTDFALTVKSVPLGEAIAQIESGDGAQQHGLFNLISKERIPLPGGDLYVLDYSAVNPTTSMIKLNQSKETIFVAGNNSQSLSFVLYSGDKLNDVGREKRKLFMGLFSSLRFFN